MKMATITVICAGMMGTAITYPAAHNGHTIRLVGSPLNNEIIEHGQKTGDLAEETENWVLC